MWKIGDAIRELREDKELTQKQLGESFGISARSISNYESGTREPSLELVAKLAQFFEVTSDYLLTGQMSIQTSPPMKIKFKSGHAASIRSDQMQDLIKMLEENKIDAEALIGELKARN